MVASAKVGILLNPPLNTLRTLARGHNQFIFATTYKEISMLKEIRQSKQDLVWAKCARKQNEQY